MSSGDASQRDLEALVAALIGRVKELEGRLDALERRSTAAASVSHATPNATVTPAVPAKPETRPSAMPAPAPSVGPKLDPWRDLPPRQASGQTPVAPMPPSPMPTAPTPPAPPTLPVVPTISAMPAPPAVPAPPYVPGPAMPASPWPPAPPMPAGKPAQYQWQQAPWQQPGGVPPQPVQRVAARPAPTSPPTLDRKVAPAASEPEITFFDEIRESLASWRDIEAQITGRLLAWVGAAAVLLGSVFFLSLAFSRGWIGPEGRVALGAIGGVVLGESGVLLLGRKQAQLGHVLVALGLAVMSLSLFAGTRYYGLYSPELALAGSFVVAVLAALIAIRYDSQAIAIYALLAIAAAPPVMGAGANLVTIAFLGITIVGTTAISLGRGWRWLPPASFLITAPQLLFWLGAKPEPGIAVAAVMAYWLLHALGASADELRKTASAKVPADVRSPLDGDVAGRPESLFLVNSILTIAGGLYALSSDVGTQWQGSFVALVAVAHFGLGGFMIWRRGENHPYAIFVNAIGATAVAIAIGRQFNGAAAVVGWAVEAAVLSAVFGFRKNAYAGGAAALLGAIEVAHLCSFEYRWLDWSLQGHSAGGQVPFTDSSAIALFGILAAALAAGWMSRRQVVRDALLVVGVILSAYSFPFELSGPSLVAAWAVEAVALVAVLRRRDLDYLLLVAAGIGWLAMAHLATYEYPMANWTLSGSAAARTPFVNSSGLALAAVLAAAGVGIALAKRVEIKVSLVLLAAGALAYALPYELSGAALVIAWAAVAATLIALWRRWPLDALPLAGLSVLLVAVLHIVCFDYPLGGWNLAGATHNPGSPPFIDPSALAAASLLAPALAAVWILRSRDATLAVAALVASGFMLVAPFELSGPALVAVWSGVIVALAIGWRRWPSDYMAGAALLGSGLSLGHLVAAEYPLSAVTLYGSSPAAGRLPFADGPGLALGLVIAAALAVGVVSRYHDLRCALAAGTLLLVAYALSFELSGLALVAAWAALVPISIAAEGLLDRLPGVADSRERLRRVALVDLEEINWPDAPLVPAFVAGALLLAHLLAYELNVADAGRIVVPATPFTDLATAGAALGAAAFLIAAVVTVRPDLRVLSVLVAAGIAAYLCVLELAMPYAVVAWCGVAALLGAWSLRDQYGRLEYCGVAALLIVAAATVTLVMVVPMDRLGVHEGVLRIGPWFDIDAAVTIGAIAACLVAASRVPAMPRQARPILEFEAGVAVVYGASVVVVNAFQTQLGGSVALEELQKQAQVGVSILWGLIGLGVFLAGTAGWRQGVREGGLGLLALATAKVFLFDLSYLDVAYRVISLIGLGLLLLVAAFLYQSLRSKRVPA